MKSRVIQGDSDERATDAQATTSHRWRALDRRGTEVAERRNRAGRVGQRPHAPVRRERDRGPRPARRLGRRRERRAHGRDGPVRLREVDAHAHPGRARPPDRGRRPDRRHRDRRAERHPAHQAAARAHRLHLPVLQPAADADGEGEHRPAAVDRGREARRRPGSTSSRPPSAWATACRTGRRSSPADSSSASPSRAPSSRSRR